MKLNEEINEIMKERFCKDTVIALATINQGIPYVRNVNAYYENGAFYCITHACSHKMKHIEMEPMVAIAGEWFTAHGKAVNLGYFGKEANHEIADKLRLVFGEWIDNGHNDFEDNNTIILCINLVDGVLLSHGTAYNIEF